MILKDYEMLLKTREMLDTKSILDADMLLRKLAIVSRGEEAMQISSKIFVAGLQSADAFPVEKHIYDGYLDASNMLDDKFDLAIATNDGISSIKRILPKTSYLLTNRLGMEQVDTKYYSKGMTLSLGEKEYILFDLR